MMNSVDKRTALQNPDLLDHIADVADTYRRPMPLDEAEDFLQSANGDLHNYYAKNKVGRQVALNDPEKASTVAEADSLRDALYSKVDDLTGEGAADLKQQYGALSNVEQELLGRKNVAARQQPQSLAEQLTTARSYGKIARGVLTGSPGDVVEGVRSAAMAKWLKDRNSTDAMITRAFSATPVPEESSEAVGGTLGRPVAGLLPAAPIIPPAPADASGPVKLPTPLVTPGTRAQRLGLLLPERTALITPPTTSESSVTGVTPESMLQRNPNTGRMQRTYQGQIGMQNSLPDLKDPPGPMAGLASRSTLSEGAVRQAMRLQKILEDPNATAIQKGTAKAQLNGNSKLLESLAAFSNRGSSQ